VVANGLLIGIAFSVPWGIFLGSFVRTGDFDVAIGEYDDGSVHKSVNVSQPFDPPEIRMVQIEGEWNPVKPGDRLHVGFVGLATGSKSTILGGYRWTQQRGGAELGRGTRGVTRFWTLFGTASLLPVLLCLSIALRWRKRGQRPKMLKPTDTP